MPIEVRAPQREEAGAIAALLNEHSQALFGVDAATVDEIAHWFDIPTIDPARDMRVAVDDGLLVAYADVGDGGPQRTRYWIDLRLRPGAVDEVGHALLDAMERRAAETAAPGALLRGFQAAADEAAGRVYEGRGYRLFRHSLRMEISLAQEPPAPVWPDGITVRTGRPSELARIHQAVDEAFSDHWEHEPQSLEDWEHWFHGPNQDPSLWFLAEDAGEIAGACLCRPHESGEHDAGYVMSLGVRRPWRRRGLALALLRHAFGEFRRRGQARVCLGVDAENTTGAVRLYERAGMRVARQHNLYEKPLD